MKVCAVIPAAGKGIRSGLAAPKQYLKIFGKEILVYTLEVFQANELIDEIIVAADPKYFKLLIKLKEKYKLSKLELLVEGGKERQDSVNNALQMLDAKDNDIIVVHDAARPLLPQSTLSDAILSAKKYGNAIVCLKAKDTLIKEKDNKFKYIKRDEIHLVQTPQVFKYKNLLSAMQIAIEDKFIGTDESMLINRLGEKLNIIEGSLMNFKVTTGKDIELLKSLLKVKRV